MFSGHRAECGSILRISLQRDRFLGSLVASALFIPSWRCLYNSLVNEKLFPNPIDQLAASSDTDLD